jgi:hypothetical protein
MLLHEPTSAKYRIHLTELLPSLRVLPRQDVRIWEVWLSHLGQRGANLLNGRPVQELAEARFLIHSMEKSTADDSGNQPTRKEHGIEKQNKQKKMMVTRGKMHGTILPR